MRAEGSEADAKDGVGLVDADAEGGEEEEPFEEDAPADS